MTFVSMELSLLQGFDGLHNDGFATGNKGEKVMTELRTQDIPRSRKCS